MPILETACRARSRSEREEDNLHDYRRVSRGVLLVLHLTDPNGTVRVTHGFQWVLSWEGSSPCLTLSADSLISMSTVSC